MEEGNQQKEEEEQRKLKKICERVDGERKKKALKKKREADTEDQGNSSLSKDTHTEEFGQKERETKRQREGERERCVLSACCVDSC